MQRYVSDELTHFAGRAAKTLEERYEVLKAILKLGELRAAPGDGSPDPGRSWFTRGKNPLSSHERYTTGLVCFCDIPVEDFPIHISKYGPFGLAWAKPYLVGRGACPVFYVAKDSVAATDPPLPRYQYFDQMAILWEEYKRAKSEIPIMTEVQGLPEGPESSSLSDEEAHRALESFREMRTYFALSDFMERHVMCFMKFFDSSLPENDPQNYYMEREWRVIGNVSFALDDVQRVILPRSFGRRFRSDIPSYAGAVHLVHTAG